MFLWVIVEENKQWYMCVYVSTLEFNQLSQTSKSEVDVKFKLKQLLKQ